MTPSTMERDTLPEVASALQAAGVVIPTFNAARHWEALRRKLEWQGIAADQILVIDSSSTDGTRQLAETAGYQVVCIEQSEFSHGGTRQLATRYLPWADVLVYLTQDALPADEHSFRTLCESFADPQVGAAYGRQLPRSEADPIERHARLFNYPAISAMRSYESRVELGLKAAFCSNSFAAYRRSALEQVGGFPINVIMAEDSVVAARLLLSGWKIAYVAEAAVIHSHPLGFRKEFARYFDTGVHHARERWLLRAFGPASREGKRFLRSEVSYLFAKDARLLPTALFRTASKLLAYRLGLRESYLPVRIKARFSAQPGFWARQTALTVGYGAGVNASQAAASQAPATRPVQGV